MNATRAVSLPSTAAPGSLPPQGGRLLAAYRIVWWVVAAAALAVPTRLLFEPAMEPAILILRLVKAAVLIAVSVILFRRRKADLVAAMLSFAFLLWTITSSFDFSGTETWPAALDRLRFLLFALALLLFPTGEWRPRWTGKVALASVAVFALGIAEAMHLLGTRLFLPLAIACVLAALAALLTRYRRLGEDAEKQQLKWVALGLVAGIGLILTARAGAASGVSSPLLLEALFQAGIVVLALGFLISLLRYRLYDAEAVISRSAAYAVLTLSLVATFAASEAMLQMFGQRYFGAGVGDLSSAIAAAIAAVLLTPLHTRITDWAEQRFQRDLIALKKELPELLDAFSTSSSVRQIGAAVLPRIEEAVHSVRSALVIDGAIVAARGLSTLSAEGWIRHWQAPAQIDLFDRDDDLDFPLRMALRCPFGSLRGWLLLGPRPDGSFHGKDDLDALAVIARPLRQTIFSVLARETEQRTIRARLEQLAAAIAELQGNLDRNGSKADVTSMRAPCT